MSFYDFICAFGVSALVSLVCAFALILGDR